MWGTALVEIQTDMARRPVFQSHQKWHLVEAPKPKQGHTPTPASFFHTTTKTSISSLT